MVNDDRTGSWARPNQAPNLVQLCIRRTAPLSPTRSTAALTSLMRALTLSASIVTGAKASEKAFMFLFASLFPAMLLKCCAQMLLRIAISHCWFKKGVPVFMFFLLFAARSYSQIHQKYSKRLSALTVKTS